MMPFIATRTATISDHAAYTRFMPEFSETEPILALERWAREMMPHTLLFEEDGVVIGYAWVVPVTTGAYFRHLVVTKNARGRGVGGVMMREIAKHMRAKGCVDWFITVALDNVPARRLYSAMGFKESGMYAVIRLPWDCVERLPTSDKPFSSRLIDPEEDVLVEQAYGLPRTRISELRSRGGWVFMRLHDPNRPHDMRIGTACFNPRFPGCLPFRMMHPSLARLLLDSLRPYALPTFKYIQLNVEDDDDALTKLLVSVGGRMLVEALNMHGKIPTE